MAGVPKAARAEDGKVPLRYGLEETGSTSYQSRTRRNVLDSDGTVIFTRGKLEGGSLLTATVARETGKPCLHLDVGELGSHRVECAQRLRDWIAEKGIRTLNVAGSRESKAHGIEHAVARFLCEALAGRRYPTEEEWLEAQGHRFTTGPDEAPYGKATGQEKKQKA